MTTHSRTSQKESGSNAFKAKPEAAQGLRDLLIVQLNDIYWAEKALTTAIPKMIDNATSPELVDALSDHLGITELHVSRLEDIFKSLGEPAKAKKCDAMEGLIKEAGDIMKSTEEGYVRDAGIILAAQKVEHYEIATYGTLFSFANLLGHYEVADWLEETLKEEKESDFTLTTVAEFINVEATEH